jgi:uncharacterized coiled-coil DUF342 family protein
MTNLVCPLCGRRVNLKSFDPTEYDLDIITVEVAGLGRGRGFKEVSSSSILVPGDPTVELIKNRILDLSKMLLDSKCLTPTEVFSTLKIEVISPKELMRRDEKITSLTNEVAFLKTQQDDEKRKSRSKDKLIEDLSQQTISLNSQIKELKEQADLHSSLSNQIIKLQTSSSKKDKIINDLSKDLKKSTKRTGEWKKQAEELQDIVDSRDETITEQEKTIDELEDKIKDLEEQISDLGEELVN